MMRYAALLLSAIVLIFSSCSGAVSGQADIESFIDDSSNFSVSYNANGGEGDIASSIHTVGSSFALDAGSSMTHPDYPLYVWNTSADASGVFYPLSSVIKMPPRDLTLYAIWYRLFAITYHDTDMDGGSPPSPNYGYPGSVVMIAANNGAFYRSGNYAFNGWNTQADGLGKNYAAGSTFVFTNTFVDLYPRWKSVPGPVPLVPQTVVGTVTPDSDHKGVAGSSCWYFNDGSYVSYDSPYMCFGYNQPFSISVWFKAAILPSFGWPHIFMINAGPSPGNFVYFLMLDGTQSGALVACMGESGNPAANSIVYPVTPDVWHHAVMVYDCSKLELYVDGISQGSTLYTVGPLPKPTGPLMLGGGADNFFNGIIGELKVYDRALGADEVMALYSN